MSPSSYRTTPFIWGPISDGFLEDLKRSGVSDELIEDIEEYNRSFSSRPEVKITLLFDQKETTMWEKLKAKVMLGVAWLKLRWVELKEWVSGLFGKKDGELKSGEKDYDEDHPA